MELIQSKYSIVTGGNVMANILHSGETGNVMQRCHWFEHSGSTAASVA